MFHQIYLIYIKISTKKRELPRKIRKTILKGLFFYPWEKNISNKRNNLLQLRITDLKYFSGKKQNTAFNSNSKL